MALAQIKREATDKTQNEVPKKKIKLDFNSPSTSSDQWFKTNYFITIF